MKKIMIFIAVLLLSSCNQSDKIYYETGELKREYIKKSPQDSLYCINYYRNGNVKSEGYLIEESYPNGVWKEFYGDGELMWEGEFVRGQRVLASNVEEMRQIKNCNPILDCYSQKSLSIGDTLFFRIISPKIHPDFYEVTISDTLNKCQRISPDFIKEEAFPYFAIVKQQNVFYDIEKDESYIRLVVFYPNVKGECIIGGDTFNIFEIPVN